MSTFEKIENNKVKLTIDISAEVFEGGIAKAYDKMKGKFDIPGFRKGKAPRKIIEQQYGQGIFFEEAFNNVFPPAYMAAVEEHKLEVVDQPEIEIVDMDPEKGITFAATVVVKPEVKLGDYKGITLEKVEYTVKDEELEAALAREQERVARMVTVEDRAVENGDNLMIDYSGSVDGVKFDGGTAENQPLTIGSGTFIPGFEEQLIGMNVGDVRDINVTFPTEYHSADLAGKEAVFNVKVNQIKAKVLPELNDDFAKDVSEFDTLDEFKADLKSKLEESAQKRAETEMENAIIEKVTENAEIDLPEVMVEHEIDEIIRDMEMRLYYQGLKLDDYLKFTNTKIEQIREENKEIATKRVRMRLVLEAIIDAEKIEADEEGVNKEIEKLAEWARKDVEEYKKSFTDQQRKYVEQQVKFDNCIKLLKEANKFE
jgi:trigger factor